MIPPALVPISDRFLRELFVCSVASTFPAGRCPTLSEKNPVKDVNEESSFLSHKHPVSVAYSHLCGLCGGVVPLVFVVLFKDCRG